MKCAVWLVVVLVIGNQLNDVVQDILVSSGVIKKHIAIQDVCDAMDLPPCVSELVGCKVASNLIEEAKDQPQKMKIKLSAKVLEKVKFETREKSLTDKFLDRLNDALVWCQRLVLPEDFVMPCLVGDCDMGDKLKKQKEEYEAKLKAGIDPGASSPFHDDDEEDEDDDDEDFDFLMPQVH